MFFPSYEKGAETVFGSKECTKPDPDTLFLTRKEYERLIRTEEMYHTLKNIIQNCKSYDIINTVKAVYPWMIEKSGPATNTTVEESTPDA